MLQVHNRRAIILTALAIEYKAVRAHLSKIQEVTYKGSVYETGLFLSEKAQWEICIAQIEVGNASAAFEAERAMIYFNPEVALFVGIAGGIKDVKLGDIVASTKVYGYESGTFTLESFHALPDVGESSHALIQRARAEARRDNWQQRISDSGRTAPTVHVGPIAAGEKALDPSATQIISLLQTTYNDTLAVEMQGRGFLKAIHANQAVQALIVRGISTLLDTKPGRNAQKFQKIAADHASAFAFEMLAQLSQSTVSPALTPSVLSPAPEREEPKKDLQIADIYIYEKGEKPTITITLSNAGNQPVLATRVNTEILDVGEFCYSNDDGVRSFVMVTHNYDITLSPELRGQIQEVRIAHHLQPGEVDPFELTIEQEVDTSRIAYVWYRLKLTIVYDSGARKAESEPIMISIPPVNVSKHNIWHEEHSIYHQQNEHTLLRMEALNATKSSSIQKAIQQYKDNALSGKLVIIENNNDPGVLRDGRPAKDIPQDSQEQKPLEIFFSYAKEDEQLMRQLSNQLATLKSLNLITDWHAGKISPGAQINNETMKHLNSAQIILLLISPDFIASQSTSREIAYAMERNNKQQTRVIPILLRPTANLENAPFSKLQTIPRNEKAITLWPRRDLAFATVAQEIGDIVREIKSE